MYRLREPRKISQIGGAFGGGAVIALVICVLMALVAYLGFALMALSSQETSEQNIQLLKLLKSDDDNVHDLSEVTVQHRKKYAQRYLDVAADVKRVQGESTKFDFDDDQWTQIKKVAKTGKPAQLDTEALSYGQPFGNPFLLIWLFVTWCIMGQGALIRYAGGVGSYSSTRMADVHWKRPTTWLVVFSLGPPAWIAMIISRVLLIWTPLEDQAENHDQAESAAIPRNQLEHQTYRSAPAAARMRYIALRTQAAVEYTVGRVQQIERDIDRCRTRSKEYGELLRETQMQINELRSRREQLKAGLEGMEATTPDLASQEFDRIRQLPGVIATQVVNDNLRLIVRATHEYKGKLYDLGDWQIDISPGATCFEATSVRSNIRPEWNGDYPVYAYEDGEFCFGDRQAILDEHQRKGQHLEAISLAIDCLCGINKGEQKYVPDAFYAIK